MFPYYVSTIRPAKWKVTVCKPLLVNKGENVSTTTARINLEVEKMVKVPQRIGSGFTIDGKFQKLIF